MNPQIPIPEIFAEIEAFCIEDVKKLLIRTISSFAMKLCFRFTRQFHEKYDEQFEGNEAKLDEIMYLVQKHVVRSWLKDEHKRVDAEALMISARLTQRD
jgi:polyribonucleotide nucleotidyltransferase